MLAVKKEKAPEISGRFQTAYGHRRIRAVARLGQRVRAIVRELSDTELVQGIRYLAEDVGVFAETAGGVTVAGALALARAGRLRPDDEVVLCITGHGLKTLEAVSGVLPAAKVLALAPGYWVLTTRLGASISGSADTGNWR